MLARIRKAVEDERGFTLIELLVVVIIIGILAAIAIPTFLSQRTKGWEAAAKAEVRNMATAQESFATDNGGSYATTQAQLEGQGYNKSPDVAVEFVTTATATYTMCASHSKGGQKFKITTVAGAGAGAPQPLARTAACA